MKATKTIINTAKNEEDIQDKIFPIKNHLIINYSLNKASNQFWKHLAILNFKLNQNQVKRNYITQG